MKRYYLPLCIALIWICSGCSSSRTLVQNTPSINPADRDFTSLETALIENYLQQPDFTIFKYEEEVRVYNSRDELEYEGKSQEPDSRIMMLKGDFLLEVDQTFIYRVNN